MNWCVRTEVVQLEGKGITPDEIKIHMHRGPIAEIYFISGEKDYYYIVDAKQKYLSVMEDRGKFQINLIGIKRMIFLTEKEIFSAIRKLQYGKEFTKKA